MTAASAALRARSAPMTEFQTGLLVIGALAIAGVLVYNRIQERGAERRAGRFSGSRHQDVLLDAAARRKEPTLEPGSAHAGERPGSRDEALPDARLDYLIELAAQSPLAMPVVLEHWEALARRYGARALLAAADERGEWHRASSAHGAGCQRLQAALQLVTRAGVANESELIEFRAQVETLASKVGASVSAPEMRHAMETARELDRVCSDADIQVALHLVAPAGRPFDRDALKAAASEVGLEPADGSQLVLRDGQGRVLYTAGERASGPGRDAPVEALTLLLDVPRVPEIRRVYESMVRCARHLATVLGGEIVDDNGHALDDRALAAIETELAKITQLLEARGIAPGGATARRLFS